MGSWLDYNSSQLLRQWKERPLSDKIIVRHWHYYMKKKKSEMPMSSPAQNSEKGLVRNRHTKIKCKPVLIRSL